MAALVAVVSGRELWYLTRATGIVALVLLTGTVVLGIVTTGDFEARTWPRFVTQGLHRNVSLLSVWFLFLHVMTTVVDGYVPIGWANAVVPFTSPYKRGWLGLGAIACDLVLALILTSLLRRRLRPATWRAVHWLAYLCWPVALLHAIGTGTDSTTVVFRWVASASVVAVAASVAWRLTRTRRGALLVRAGGAFGLLVVLAGAAYGLEGGLRPSAPTLSAAPPAVPSPTTSAPTATPPTPATTTPAPRGATTTTPPRVDVPTTTLPVVRPVDLSPPTAGPGQTDDGVTTPVPTTPTTTTTTTTATTTTQPPPPPPPPPTSPPPSNCGLFGCEDGGSGGDR